jgi:ABC-2 type transport system permease protein
MKELLTLLKPRYLAFRKGRSGQTAGTRNAKLLIMGTIGLTFWGGTFAVFYRILKYFQGTEGFGDILAYKLLSMVLMTFFALLIFSSIITSLSQFYLSRDLTLVHSLPVPAAGIFLARFLESTLDSSWMAIIYSLPVFLSYGIVYRADIFFYGSVVMAILSLCLIASALSSCCVMLAALMLPAGRIRSVFIFLGLILFLVLILAFRLMRPEQLVDPEAFASVLLYFRSLSTPASPLLPTTWIYDGLRASLMGDLPGAFFHLSLAWSFAVTMIFVAFWIAGVCYFTGFSKAQTAPEKLFPVHRGAGERSAYSLVNLLPEPARAFAAKEVKTFFRDQTQWPQLFLLVALIVVYIYNFSVLPLEKSPIKTIYLQNVISFLNMGLAAFVLTAVAARFVFPAVSTEGEAFWIVRTSPVTISTFLWVKFFVYYAPLLLLAEILIVVTNILLHVTPFMMWLSAATIFFMVPGIVAMALGLGATYPDFKSENPAQAVTSFGGLLFMLFSAVFIGLIIVLEAGPVYTVFMAGVSGKAITFLQWLWLAGSFLLALLLCALAVVVPMRLGIAGLMDVKI